METVATFRRGEESARVVVWPSGAARAVQEGEWCEFGDVLDAIEYLEGLRFVRVGG